MLDRHRAQNQAWLRARAEENDRERRELCRLRVSKTADIRDIHFFTRRRSVLLPPLTIHKHGVLPKNEGRTSRLAPGAWLHYS